MDTSKEYILMCEKAVEIQTVWLPYTGDFFKSSFGVRVLAFGEDFYYAFYLCEPKFSLVGKDFIFKKEKAIKFTWLPRQEQLQEMVINKLNAGQLSMIFEDWRQDNIPNLENNYSMEQLWLTFVMKKKFSKRWNGKDWEVKNERLTRRPSRSINQTWNDTEHQP